MSATKALQAKMEKLGHKSDIFVVDDYDPINLGPGYEFAMTSDYGRFALKNFISRTYWAGGGQYIAWASMILQDLIQQANYKCIVSLMPLTYKMVTYTLSKYNHSIPYIIIPTDWEDPCIRFLGMEGFWIDGPDALYILGTDALWEQCPSQYKKKRVDGMVLIEQFTEDIQPKDIRRTELGLPSDKPVVLVIFGKCASSEMTKTAMLMKNNRKYHFVFICGSNTQIEKAINKIKTEHNCNHYTVYGLVDCPHKIMQACDIFIGKPGPGALSEAMCYKLPILYSKNGILLQEIYNGNYIESSGLGHGFFDTKELPGALDQMCTNINTYIEAYDKIKPNNALNQIADVLVGVLGGDKRVPNQ